MTDKRVNIDDFNKSGVETVRYIKADLFKSMLLSLAAIAAIVVLYYLERR